MATTRLEFDVLANDRASDKLDKIGKSFGRFGSIARTTGNNAASSMGRMGAGIAGAAKMGGAGIAVLGASLVAAAPQVFNMAGQLELMGKKSAVVFGGQLGMVDKWAGANANAMGLTKREATGLAAGLADLLIPMGFNRKAAADMSTQTVGLAGALAEWSGGTKTATEVTDILSAAFMGERDGLNALGISITQAEVDAVLLAKGQDKLTGKAKQQAEALATQKLIMEKSTDAQKAFADGGDSLSRKMETSKAKLKEMGQELLVKATPALTSLADLIATKVIPKIAEFGRFVDENKFQIQGAFIDIALAVTGLVKTFGPALRFMDKIYMDFIQNMVDGAAKAFGWVPEIGDKLKAASAGFGKYREVHDKAMDGVIEKSKEWNTQLAKLKTEVKLKADISNWETQLKTAKTQLSDKNLTKERKATLTATIKDLSDKLLTARGKLDATWITKARIAKLQADKTDLDTKITAAKTKLGDPKLTATKKAKLTADIVSLQRQVNAAQTKIDTLKGKAVTVDVKFTSLGYTLALGKNPLMKKMATGGGVHGPGGPTGDKIPALLSDDEHVWTAREVKGAGGHAAVERMRKAALAGLPGFAAGGRVAGAGATLYAVYERAVRKATERAARMYAGGFGPYGAALGLARGQAGKPYGWGAFGPAAYDCSGYMSAIANRIRGRNPFSRLGSTGTFPWGGFARGPGLFMIGSRRGNPGHMAGTLLGVNVESRGGDGVVTGSRARGARHGLFGGNVWHLARLAEGGRAGDAAFDLLDPRGRDYLGGRLEQAIRRGVLNRDSGGPLPTGTSLVHNGTGQQEWISRSPAQPITVQLVLDGKVIQQSLLKLKRNTRGELGLA